MIIKNLQENDDGSMDFDFKVDKTESEFLISFAIKALMREGIIKDVMERLSARGLSAGNVEKTLNKLRRKRKDYLREVKRAVSNMIFGTIKQKTIVKPNRRGIFGIKGNRKVKTKINVILDVSGSMHGLIEKVLNYVFRNDIEINLIQADTQVNAVQNLKNGKGLETVKLIGFGGTILQPAVEYVVENCNKYNTVILTDGYCDSLDLSKLRGRVLIITAGVKVPISINPKPSIAISSISLASLSKPAASPTGFLNFNPKTSRSKLGSSNWKVDLTNNLIIGRLKVNLVKSKVK